jgi:hypothetical protein
VITLEKTTKNTDPRLLKKNKSYKVRLIGKDGQPSEKNLSDEKEAIEYADENSNPKEGTYAHVYEKIYTTAPQKTQ